jgi:hypothetical protein
MAETEYYKMHMSRPDFFPAFRKRLEQSGIIEQQVLSWMARLEPFVSGRRGARGLDIGTGTGETLSKVVNQLSSCIRGKLKVDCVEPSSQNMSGLEINAEIHNVLPLIQKIYTEKWEDFEPEYEYDFITANQCFQGITEWQDVPAEKNSLYKVYACLKTPGIAMVSLPSNYSTFYKFWQALSGDASLGKCAEDIQNELTRLGISFEQTSDYARFEVADLLTDKPDMGARKSLSYMCREDLTNPDKRDVLQERQHLVDRLAERDGQSKFFQNHNLSTWMLKE